MTVTQKIKALQRDRDAQKIKLASNHNASESAKLDSIKKEIVYYLKFEGSADASEIPAYQE